MRSAINYYYNLYPRDIHQSGKYWKFSLNKDTYIMMVYYRNNDELISLIKLSQMLVNYGYYVHQFVPNINNEYITIINNISYVLLKVYVDLEKTITLHEIMQTNIMLPIMDNESLRRDDWWSLWTSKIDYFEYQVNQFGIKYPLIRESFSYFVGLAETSISLVKNTSTVNPSSLYLNHKRIKINYTLDDLYNPLNIILDYRMRDVCEYFKDSFFKDTLMEKDIYDYIKNGSFSKEEIVLFLARMIYPSSYFDIYENILEESKEEQSLQDIIFRTVSYEALIKRIYAYIKRYYDIPNIEWLNE